MCCCQMQCKVFWIFLDFQFFFQFLQETSASMPKLLSIARFELDFLKVRFCGSLLFVGHSFGAQKDDLRQV